MGNENYIQIVYSFEAIILAKILQSTLKSGANEEDNEENRSSDLKIIEKKRKS